MQSKAPAASGAETYNKLDDTSLLGDSLTSEPGDFKRALEKQAAEATGSDVTDASKTTSESDDVKASRDSSGSASDVTASPSKSESDRESPKKNRKSTSSTNDAKPEEKKKKVKTHRRVSSASGALMAIGERK